MPFVFDATPKGANANSYTSVEYADDFLGGELYADEWVLLSNGNPADLLKKQQALVKATRRLERLTYKGDRSAYSGQALKHPRTGLETDDELLYSGNTVIEPVQQATALLALFYLKNDPAELVENSLRQFSKLRIAGAIDIEMRDQLPSTDLIPDDVMSLVTPFITAGPGITRIRRA